MTVFMNGKQVRVRRLPTIDGMDAAEFKQYWQARPAAGRGSHVRKNHP